MNTLNPAYPPAIVDGYLRHIAAALHDNQFIASAPLSWHDWYEYAVMDNGLTEEEIHENCFVYYPQDNSWGVPSKEYRAIQLVCSPKFQPRKATLVMEMTLTNQSTYTLRYKASGYAVDENPILEHNGDTKSLREWADHLGLEMPTMQARLRQFVTRGETVAWLLRPRYQHSKCCDEQA